MNLTRVLLGGLVAGFVIVTGEFTLNGIILAADWEAFRQQMGLRPLSTLQTASSVVISLAYVQVLVWIYVAIRPRFGAGPTTAIMAGYVLWILAYVLFTASLLAGGMLTVRLTIATIIWGAFEAPLAAVAGAWLYRED